MDTIDSLNSNGMFGNTIFQKQILLGFVFFFKKKKSIFIQFFLILSQEVKY
jgi:hypothetical protein